MYIPSHYAEQHANHLHALIETYPLGTWIVPSETIPLINHIPFLLDAEHNLLLGHVARANPVWQATRNSVVVIFHGPQGYVSPSWYPSKQEHHRAVPTWNYAVAHVHGTFEPIQDPEWLLQHVSQLSQKHEATQPKPWRISDAPCDYIDKMLTAIVGIKIHIERIEGKFKLGQNRSDADRAGAVRGLNGTPRASDTALADWMKLYKG
jgi:transcriptional regulator